MSAEYSVESLQHLILAQHSSTSTEAIAALRAFQERIKADESAVPSHYGYRYPDGFIRHDGGGKCINGAYPIETIPYFTHPPAQAAQGELPTEMSPNAAASYRLGWRDALAAQPRAVPDAPRTIYDQRVTMTRTVEAAAPRLYVALKNLLAAIEERSDRAGIESVTIQEAHSALLAATPSPGESE